MDVRGVGACMVGGGQKGEAGAGWRAQVKPSCDLFNREGGLLAQPDGDLDFARVALAVRG